QFAFSRQRNECIGIEIDERGKAIPDELGKIVVTRIFGVRQQCRCEIRPVSCRKALKCRGENEANETGTIVLRHFGKSWQKAAIDFLRCRARLTVYGVDRPEIGRESQPPTADKFIRIVY